MIYNEYVMSGYHNEFPEIKQTILQMISNG